MLKLTTIEKLYLHQGLRVAYLQVFETIVLQRFKAVLKIILLWGLLKPNINRSWNAQIAWILVRSYAFEVSPHLPPKLFQKTIVTANSNCN